MQISEISTPALILDEALIKENMRIVNELARDTGVKIRPHYKSHRSPWLAKFQVDNGAIGMCCSTLGEAEDCADAGIKDVLVANQLVTGHKIKRAAQLAKKTKLTVCVDDEQNILNLEKAAAEAGSTIYIFVEFEVGLERCGVDTKEEALALAKLVMQQPHLSFRGIQAYEGHISHEPDTEKAYEISLGVEKRLTELKDYLEQNGIKVEEVSGLSTASFSLRRKMGKTVYTEAQCGSFLFMGDEYKNIPYPPFKNSLFVLTTVISAKNRSFHTDAGMKTCSVDNGTPVLKDHPELPSRMSEEHISHYWDNHPYKAGDQVVYIPGHCCTTVNLHDHIYLVSGDEVVRVIEVKSRGKSQ